MTAFARVAVVARAKRFDSLSEKRVIAFAIVDAEDHKELSQHCWYLSSGYPVRWSSSFEDYGHGSVGIHRHLLGFSKHDPRVVHHINRDKLDNRRANLRVFETSGAHTAHHAGLRREASAQQVAA